MNFSIVVAFDQNRGIGKAGDMPWRLPEDMAHFRKITSTCASPTQRNAVIMGRRTWDSIPDRFRPLAERLNIVLTRNLNLALPTGTIRSSNGVRAALADLAASPQREQVSDVFVIGGGSIYREAIELPSCTKLYVTRILAIYDCDTYFPQYAQHFHCARILGDGADGDVEYIFELWERTPTN